MTLAKILSFKKAWIKQAVAQAVLEVRQREEAIAEAEYHCWTQEDGGIEVSDDPPHDEAAQQWNDYQRKLVPGDDDTPEKLARIERDIRMLTNERDRLRAALRAG